MIPSDILSSIIPDPRMRLLSKDLRDRYDDESVPSFFSMEEAPIKAQSRGAMGQSPLFNRGAMGQAAPLIMLKKFPLGFLERYGILDNLTCLKAEHLALKDLTYIKKCTTLTSLSLYDNNLTTLDGISELKNLKELCIASNDVQDLSDLKNCTALEKLTISHASIFEDLATIIPALKTLCIQGPALYEYTYPFSKIVLAVSKFQHIESLAFDYYSDVSNLSPLEHLPLRVLDIKKTDVNTMPVFPLLTELALPANFVDIYCIIKCKSLKKLDISGALYRESESDYYILSSHLAMNCLHMMGPIGDKLDELDISRNHFDNIDFLQIMPNLKVLKLNLSTIENQSLKPLSFCKNLEHLDVSDTNLEFDVVDMSPIKDIVNLKHLDV